MSNLVPHHFEGLEVRIVQIADKTYFVAKDAAEALGYADATTAIRSHCKGVQKLHPLLTEGGMQNVRVIDEPDLMRLVVNSTLPSATRFERWVFEDVLPSIRKTGGYAMPTAKPQRAADRYRDAAVIAHASIKLCKLLGVETNMARVITADLVSKESGVDCTPMLAGNIAVQDVPVTPSKIGEAMEPTISGKKVNAMLLELGLQTKDADGVYHLTEAGKAFGVTEPFKSKHSEHVGHCVKWYSRVTEQLTEHLGKQQSNVVKLQGTTA